MSEAPTRIEPWFSLQGAPNARAEAAQLERMLAAAELAESRGCRRIWLESAAGLAQPSDSLRLALAVAARVVSLRVVATQIRVDLSASEEGARSWIRLAEDAATADGICGGRLELAFAPLSDSAASFEPFARRLRDAWCGAPVAPGEGDKPIEIHPRPYDREGPKLWTRVDSAAGAQAAAAAGLSIVTEREEFAAAHRRLAEERGEVDAESLRWCTDPGEPADAAGSQRVLRLSVPESADSDAQQAWLARVDGFLR